MILNQVDNCQVMINVSGISKRKSLETKKKKSLCVYEFTGPLLCIPIPSPKFQDNQ